MHSKLNARVIAARPRDLLFLLAGALTLGLNPGCSTAAAVGCVSGIAAGAAFMSIGAAASNGQVDPGQALLSGTLFGAITGCTAAGIAAGLAERGPGGEHARRPIKPSETEDLTAAPAATPVRPDQVSAHADLEGITVTWNAKPASDTKLVKMRFKRFGPMSVFATCEDLTIQIDDRELHFPIQKGVNAKTNTVAEVAEAKVELEVIRAMQSAKSVQFQICALRRKLNLAGSQALDGFVDDFIMRAPPGVVPELSAAAKADPVTATPSASDATGP